MELGQKNKLLFVRVLRSCTKNPNDCRIMASHTVPSGFEKADSGGVPLKIKVLLSPSEYNACLWDFYHNERFTEIPNHTHLINSPFLKPPPVSYNCQPFKQASIISYTFICYLLTAAEEASRNTDKIAAVGLITVKLFSVVVFLDGLTGHQTTE